MHLHIERVKRAIEELRQGKMVILVDDLDRENEGDLIIAAEKITDQSMNFFIRQGTGIVCVSLPQQRLNDLQIPLMVPVADNSSAHQTPFTISIDAKAGITTGVSAADRVKTIELLINQNTQPSDLARPGHIYPLVSKEGGVFERRGHTEGSLDLMKISGLKPAAVICEIMNPDGTMAKGEQLAKFSQTHQIMILSIEDIFIYRLHEESLFREEASTKIPLSNYGTFHFTVFKEKYSDLEHIVLTKDGSSFEQGSPLVRVHSSCLTGDLFASEKCDCQNQLHYSLERISQEGGILIYLNQEGRGIGLLNKIKAYELQRQGLDTVEANEKLNLPVDARQYYLAANILHKFKTTNIRLLTNNPQKVNQLKKYGIVNLTREAVPLFVNKNNEFYIDTKRTKLAHLIDTSYLNVHNYEKEKYGSFI